VKSLEGSIWTKILSEFPRGDTAQSVKMEIGGLRQMIMDVYDDSIARVHAPDGWDVGIVVKHADR
jgi:hypothetical protein